MIQGTGWAVRAMGSDRNTLLSSGAQMCQLEVHPGRYALSGKKITPLIVLSSNLPHRRDKCIEVLNVCTQLDLQSELEALRKVTDVGSLKLKKHFKTQRPPFYLG